MSDKILKTLEKTIKKTSKKIYLENTVPDTNKLLALAKITGAYIALKKEIRLGDELAKHRDDPQEKKNGCPDYYDQMCLSNIR